MEDDHRSVAKWTNNETATGIAESKRIDVNLLRNLYPNPKPAKPSPTCGYCVGGALMAFVDGITAAMADEGHKANWRNNYFPLLPELAETLQKANPDLPLVMAKRYADFITRLNDRKKFHLSWSYLKEALEWKEGEITDPMWPSNLDTR